MLRMASVPSQKDMYTNRSGPVELAQTGEAILDHSRTISSLSKSSKRTMGIACNRLEAADEFEVLKKSLCIGSKGYLENSK